MMRLMVVNGTSRFHIVFINLYSFFLRIELYKHSKKNHLGFCISVFKFSSDARIRNMPNQNGVKLDLGKQELFIFNIWEIPSIENNSSPFYRVPVIQL